MELPKRKTIRLSKYDYSQNGYYFITICTQDRKCIFGNIIDPIVGADQCVCPMQDQCRPIPDQCVCPTNDDLMKLNDVGKMINKWLIKIPEHFIGSSLDIYQIMPNHIHFIIVIERQNGLPHKTNGSTYPINGSTHWSTPTEYALGNMVQWFKTMSTNEYINNVKNNHWQPFNKRLWQRNYYEHVIRNELELTKIREYIKSNPLMWNRDRNNPVKEGI